MSTATPALMTVEDLDALPDKDGIDRELIRGELRERPMTRRNRFHTLVEAQVARLVGNWLADQPKPRGAVASGEVGCIMRRDPDTSFGIDAAYFSQEVVNRQSDETQMFEGTPVLAVEVLSPLDKHVDGEKVREYLDCGVSVVWVIDPDFRTVQVHRRDNSPEMFNQTMSLSGGSDLPGFEGPVAELFE